jgi:hypothetical protein
MGCVHAVAFEDERGVQKSNSDCSNYGTTNLVSNSLLTFDITTCLYVAYVLYSVYKKW